MAYKGYKKRLFVTFVYMGVLFTLAVSFQTSWQMLLFVYILANMSFGASNFVYDAYLPDVTTKERMDRVSAWGYGMGYIGGSTIPFVVSIFLLLFGYSLFGINEDLAVRISIVMTAVWWGIFSIPMIKNVHHRHGVESPKKGFMKETVKSVGCYRQKNRKKQGDAVFPCCLLFLH
jgi:UMF1 family MFS transporter